ncbi:MAG: hypothetical protein IPP22_15930 [Nitrosomonas sp.]|nr:hypothetical protein [Nitrosomonas sp.]
MKKERLIFLYAERALKIARFSMIENLHWLSVIFLDCIRTASCRWILLLTIATAIAGCHSFGPNALRGTHPLYNDAIVGSLNDQFIHNIVRLHYRDPPLYLDVASVTASMKLEMSGGVDHTTSGADIFQYTLGAAYSTSPTISYVPLQGENFVKSMLSPIPLEALFSFSGSGWSPRRVFSVCVERINGIENSPKASGPTPRTAPHNDQQFMRLMQLIEEISHRHLIVPRINRETKEPQLEIKSSPEFHEQIREIKDLLGLDQNIEVYHLNSDFLRSRPDTISIRTRSLTGIFFYLSHNVETPQSHKEAGLVTVTHNQDGSEFNWGTTAAGRLFQIRQSQERPNMAAVAIPYRGRWFYLADNDLESKSTFMLLIQLFRLQAGAANMAGPTLTIPVR